MGKCRAQALPKSTQFTPILFVIQGRNHCSAIYHRVTASEPTSCCTDQLLIALSSSSASSSVCRSYCEREFRDCRLQTCYVQSPAYPGIYPRALKCRYRLHTRQPFIKLYLQNEPFSIDGQRYGHVVTISVCISNNNYSLPAARTS